MGTGQLVGIPLGVIIMIEAPNRFLVHGDFRRCAQEVFLVTNLQCKDGQGVYAKETKLFVGAIDSSSSYPLM
jgi:hypothetical protein